jgi:GrpB-like predicted nucleotidyltransferase (UPF0157 family)
MPNPIVIVEYDPAWPEAFEGLRERAATAVGNVAIAIEHIGSTAVPGLAAKPVIDLVIVVESPDVARAIDRLTAIGYVHRGNLGVEGREAFDAPKGERGHHLYVCPSDSEELRAQLAFRDRLRNEPVLASEYEALKRDLAARFREDRMGYTDAKTDFVVAASQPTEPKAHALGGSDAIRELAGDRVLTRVRLHRHRSSERGERDQHGV